MSFNNCKIPNYIMILHAISQYRKEIRLHKFETKQAVVHWHQIHIKLKIDKLVTPVRENRDELFYIHTIPLIQTPLQEWLGQWFAFGGETQLPQWNHLPNLITINQFELASIEALLVFRCTMAVVTILLQQYPQQKQFAKVGKGGCRMIWLILVMLN